MEIWPNEVCDNTNTRKKYKFSSFLGVSQIPLLEFQHLLLCTRDQTWDDGSWLRTDQAAFFTHSLEKFHKIQINSNKFSRNSNKLGKIGIKLEQAVSKATWLTTVRITSEGREQSDLTYNLQADCGLTVVGREHSDLTYNSANYQWRKRAQRPDVQYFSLCHRPLLEGSKATWWTTLSTAAQTVVGRERSGLTSTQT